MLAVIPLTRRYPCPLRSCLTLLQPYCAGCTLADSSVSLPCATTFRARGPESRACTKHRDFTRIAAFTLIEMLVVVGLLGILAALLFPVLSQARARARQTACISNLRQIGLALELYRQDWNELPPLLSQLHPAYLRDARLLICPNDGKSGQYPGNPRLEGNTFLTHGVSYEYIPNWLVARELAWWQPAPAFGPGKWDDLTPVVQCPWHWARYFDPALPRNPAGAKGWELVLMLSGAVRKVRVEDPPEAFTPAKYR